MTFEEAMMQTNNTTAPAAGARNPARRITLPTDPGHDDKAAAAFHYVSKMENGVSSIIDLGYAVILAANCETGLEQHYASAIERLGRLIVKKAGALQERREQTFLLLHPYAFPNAAVDEAAP